MGYHLGANLVNDPERADRLLGQPLAVPPPSRVQPATGFGEVAGARVWSAGVGSLAGTHKVKWFL